MSKLAQRATPSVSRSARAKLLGATKRISRVMETVRLDACGWREMNHLWVMDMLHDLRADLYRLREQVKEAS